MGERRRARQAALQILFQLDGDVDNADMTMKRYWQHLSEVADVQPFADELVQLFLKHRDDVDSILRDVSTHWRLERMSRVDRSILRLGTVELMYNKETPTRVVLNEAVTLAKQFGSEESAAFVNGVLDRVAQQQTGEK